MCTNLEKEQIDMLKFTVIKNTYTFHVYMYHVCLYTKSRIHFKRVIIYMYIHIAAYTYMMCIRSISQKILLHCLSFLPSFWWK